MLFPSALTNRKAIKNADTYSVVNSMQPIGAVEMIGLQKLILQGMLSTNRHDRLRVAQGLKALRPAGLLPPRLLLLQYMEQCHNVAETAVG